MELSHAVCWRVGLWRIRGLGRVAGYGAGGCALAAAGHADERERGAGLDLQRDACEHRRLHALRVRKVDALQCQVALHRAQRAPWRRTSRPQAVRRALCLLACSGAL